MTTDIEYTEGDLQAMADEAHFHALKHRYFAGKITAEEFEAEVSKMDTADTVMVEGGRITREEAARLIAKQERPRQWNGELGTDLTFTFGSTETLKLFTEFWLNGLMVNGRNEKSRVIDEVDEAIAALLKEKFSQALGVDDFTVESRLFIQDNAFDGPSLPTEQEQPANDLTNCPICNSDNIHYRNIGRGHWFVCEVCQIKWLAGSNLFSSWRDETEEDWKKNFEYLSQFREYHPDTNEIAF